MIAQCRQNLLELKKLLESLTADQYQQKLEVLSGVSIGQHIRHILEFYICLAKGIATGTVNYDARKRDLNLETNVAQASFTIDNIIEQLDEHKKIELSQLACNYTNAEGNPIVMSTSYQRELSYCLEHSIHHQALIKVGLKELKLESLIQENFGVAPATRRYQKSSA